MKKIIILSGLIGICLLANAQQKDNSFTIKGYIEGLDTRYLYTLGLPKRDSIPVKDGYFTYTGTGLKSPVQVSMSDKKAFNIVFYAENTIIDIQGKFTAPSEVLITGGMAQQDFNALNASVNSQNQSLNQLRKASSIAYKAKDKGTLAQLEEKIKPIEDEKLSLMKVFITKHPKSYVSLDQIKKMDYTTDYFEMNTLFLSLNSSIRATARGKELDSILTVLKRGSNGQKMIDFKQNQPNGIPISFSSFKGKYVLVDFWASWCGPCRDENPKTLNAYNKYKDKGFTVLGVSIDSKKDNWEKAIREDQMPWIQVSDLKGAKNEVAVYYGIHAIPSNYLVDRNGIIIARNLRGKDLEDKLEDLLRTKSK